MSAIRLLNRGSSGTTGRRFLLRPRSTRAGCFCSLRIAMSLGGSRRRSRVTSCNGIVPCSMRRFTACGEYQNAFVERSSGRRSGSGSLFELYRRSHSQHHRNSYLTYPGENTESYYHEQEDWEDYGSLSRWLLIVNQTFLGRLFIGPFLRTPHFVIKEF